GLGRVTLWDTASGETQGTLEGHPGGVGSIVFSRNGKQLATAGKDRGVQVLDLATRKPLASAPWLATSLAFAPGRAMLAVGGKNGTVRLWDLHRPEQCRLLPGHVGEVTALAFSPRGHLLASGDESGVIRLWEPGTGQERSGPRGPADQLQRIAFSPPTS